MERLTDSLDAGAALYEAKLAVVPDIGGRTTRLMNQYDFNLYGDPAVGLDSAVAGTNTLTVSSAYGMADPPVGLHYYESGTNVTCMVTNAALVFRDEQSEVTCVCTGWTGSGSVPAVGAGTNTGNLALLTDSTIDWQWAIWDVVLSNQTVTAGLTTQAVNSVTARDGFTVESSGTATFRAGNVVRLSPGFRARTGSVFRATIGLE